MADVTAEDPLAGTGVAVRDAGPGDAVAGVRPRWVALPESVEEVAAVLRACAERDLAVVPAGGGTKLHWGLPPERCDVLLDMCCMNEIIEHAAGDLVVRAQAGVTMSALAAELAAKGQELVLDVPFGEDTTVGGTLATAVAGPRAFRYGTARDLLIGITVVLADGTIAKSGGKVVKNVAGYDLGKLFTGSYGTLGVIAEATFRLHPLPAERRWVVARVEPGPGFQELVAALAAAQSEPSAVEIDWPGNAPEPISEMPARPETTDQPETAAQPETTGQPETTDRREAGGRPGGRGPVTLAVLVEGTAAEERAQALREVVGAGSVVAEPPPWWGRIMQDEPLLEVRFPPARAGEALAAAQEAGFALRGSPVTGRYRLAPSGESLAAQPGAQPSLQPDAQPDGQAGEGDAFARVVAGLREQLEAMGGRVTVLASPYEGVELWGRVGTLPLMRRVKERFDPGRRMSPGRFVGGI